LSINLILRTTLINQANSDSLIKYNIMKLSFNLKNEEKLTNKAYIVSRILIGLFFFVAGFNKLFHPIFQGYMLNTITKIGFPAPIFTANFTAFCECLFGLLLLLGFLTRFSSLVLTIVILVALFTHDLASIPKELVPIDPKVGVYKMDAFTWIGYFLYLPQALYLMFLILFFIGGDKQWKTIK